jgi:hypothetical protein
MEKCLHYQHLAYFSGIAYNRRLYVCEGCGNTITKEYIDENALKHELYFTMTEARQIVNGG